MKISLNRIISYSRKRETPANKNLPAYCTFATHEENSVFGFWGYPGYKII